MEMHLRDRAVLEAKLRFISLISTSLCYINIYGSRVTGGKIFPRD